MRLTNAETSSHSSAAVCHHGSCGPRRPSRRPRRNPVLTSALRSPWRSTGNGRCGSRSSDSFDETTVTIPFTMH